MFSLCEKLRELSISHTIIPNTSMLIQEATIVYKLMTFNSHQNLFIYLFILLSIPGLHENLVVFPAVNF